jgi:hypothetical protein
MLPLRGDGDRRADRDQLISVPPTIAVETVARIGAVRKDDDMTTHCRTRDPRTPYPETLSVV